jgi:hypothetical protein
MLCVPIRHAILVALFTQIAAAQQVATDVRIPSDVAQFQGLRIDGPANHARTQMVLDELTWHPTLKKAAVDARKQGRPILWIHALGRLQGYC